MRALSVVVLLFNKWKMSLKPLRFCKGVKIGSGYKRKALDLRLSLYFHIHTRFMTSRVNLHPWVNSILKISFDLFRLFLLNINMSKRFLHRLKLNIDLTPIHCSSATSIALSFTFDDLDSVWSFYETVYMRTPNSRCFFTNAHFRASILTSYKWKWHDCNSFRGNFMAIQKIVV